MSITIEEAHAAMAGTGEGALKTLQISLSTSLEISRRDGTKEGVFDVEDALRVVEGALARIEEIDADYKKTVEDL